jgi:hypothetical protein
MASVAFTPFNVFQFQVDGDFWPVADSNGLQARTLCQKARNRNN